MLTKEDLSKIKKLIDTCNNIINARLDSFESYVRRRFDEADLRFEKIERKIDQLIRTEEEDIQVAYKEIKDRKLRFRL